MFLEERGQGPNEGMLLFLKAASGYFSLCLCWQTLRDFQEGSAFLDMTYPSEQATVDFFWEI